MLNSSFIVLFDTALLYFPFFCTHIIMYNGEGARTNHLNLQFTQQVLQITVIAYLNIRQPNFSCDSLPLGKSFEVKSEKGGFRESN